MFRRIKKNRALKRIYQPNKAAQIRKIHVIVAGHASLLGSIGTTLEGISQRLNDLTPVIVGIERMLANQAWDAGIRDVVRDVPIQLRTLGNNIGKQYLTSAEKLNEISCGVADIESAVIAMKDAGDEAMKMAQGWITESRRIDESAAGAVRGD